MPPSSPVRQLSRNLMLSYFCGVQGWRKAPGIPVLGYHSVGHLDSYINILPRLFEVQMDEIESAGYRGVSLKALVDLLEGGNSLPRNMVALTFDDGLRNFAEHAWPALAGRGFGATLFVPTDFVGGTAGWYAANGLDPLPMLAWDEIRDLQRHGADIQSHGCSHRRLRGLSPAELELEASVSKSLLEKELGQTVDLYCYPFGEVSAGYERALKKAGYRAAVTVRQSLCRKCGDPLRIPRQILDYITISDEPTARLAIRACLNGGYARYVRTRNAFKCLRFRASSAN